MTSLYDNKHLYDVTCRMAVKTLNIHATFMKHSLTDILPYIVHNMSWSSGIESFREKLTGNYRVPYLAL